MPRTVDELRAISEDVLYELQMLFSTSNRLRDHVKGIARLEWDVQMACIESFAVHARLLQEFIWGNPNSRHPDDAFAADFLPPGEWAKHRKRVQRSALSDLRRRAGREIVHLSYTRVHLSTEAREWPFDVIADVIGKAFRLFLEFVPSDVLCEPFEERLREAWPEHQNYPIAIGFPPDQNPIRVATQTLQDASQIRQATFDEMLP